MPMKYYALMLFYTAYELNETALPPYAYLLKNILYYNNGSEALEAYANTMCPASQLVEGNTEEELNQKICDMVINYSNQEWLNINLYPYL